MPFPRKEYQLPNTTLWPLFLPTLDSGGAPSQQQVGYIMYDTTRGSFSVQMLLDTNPHAQTLPGATVYLLYLRNVDPKANITVTWTPTGGASVVTHVLAPNAVILVSDNPGGAGGITALSLQSDTANASYEIGLLI